MYVEVYGGQKEDGENYEDRFFFKVTPDFYDEFSEYESRIIRERVNRNECLKCHHPVKYHDKDGCHHQNLIGKPCYCKKFETVKSRT